MQEERGISMNEFKMVVESFRSDMKKIIEVVNHRFDRMDGRMDSTEGKMGKLEGRMDGMEGKMVRLESSMGKLENRLNKNEKNVEIIKEQVGLLIEGQAEIKAELRNKVSYTDFSKLEKRVARLERKIA